MDSDESDYRIVESSVLPEVTNVRIYHETIEKIRTGHPEVPIELPTFQDAIDNTLQSPTRVAKSYNNSYVFIDDNTTNKSGDPFNVPVKVVDEGSSRLKSAYFASSNNPGEVVWQNAPQGDEDED